MCSRRRRRRSRRSGGERVERPRCWSILTWIRPAPGRAIGRRRAGSVARGAPPVVLRSGSGRLRRRSGCIRCRGIGDARCARNPGLGCPCGAGPGIGRHRRTGPIVNMAHARWAMRACGGWWTWGAPGPIVRACPCRRCLPPRHNRKEPIACCRMRVSRRSMCWTRIASPRWIAAVWNRWCWRCGTPPC